ncbi:hypothetical protein [Microvirga tunisiensis]|uniref:AAA+ ATPase domain-containing protein n=1 Tax=Microvirga tunisiensis TaxID=2108360 RepID=A0A5N7MA96_9HYPH|nr:hypothetical protein [Microvirga tunisiensis]MPR05641.1 hypothetical protein [Microvirga tunisiensis]MPR23841.1 hypothetical protein [Microvirga tunisiensis]
MNDPEVMRHFMSSLPRAGLVRLLGESGAGRTSVALRIAEALTSASGHSSGKCVALIDTLGHGKEALEGVLPKALDADRVVYYQGAGMCTAMGVARHLCFKPDIAVVVIDDLLGLDPATGPEGTGSFGSMVRRQINVLASACLSQNVLGILVDRLSPSWLSREPIGCSTYIVSAVKHSGVGGRGYQLRRVGNIDPSRPSDVIIPAVSIGNERLAEVA